MKDKLKKYISKLIFFKKLPNDLKKKIFIVGGIFPALYNNKPINDIDLIVKDVKAFQLELSKFFKRDFHLISDNRGNMVLKFIFRQTHYDITQLLENFNKDAERRDFTVNSVYYSFVQDKIIDPLNGLSDIKSGLLRMCSKDFLLLDPIRYLRFYRVKLIYKLKVEPETEKIINSFLLKNLMAMPKERIYYEFKKLFAINPSFNTIKELEKRKVVSSIIKPLQLLKNDEKQNKFHSFGIYTHSLLVYKWIEYYQKKYGYFRNSFILKTGGLLHDIGKENTRTRDDAGQYHFYGHEKIGYEEVKRFLETEPLSKKEKALLMSLVKNHMVLAYLKFNNKITQRSLRKFIEFANIYTMEHIILFLADGAAAHDKVDSEQESFISKFLLELEEFKRMLNRKKQKIINGNDLLKIGYEPGKLLGNILKEINDLYAEGQIKTKTEALKYARKNLKDR